eukprot:scaffold114925_cov41-Attheya_sp.AAC.1
MASWLQKCEQLRRNDPALTLVGSGGRSRPNTRARFFPRTSRCQQTPRQGNENASSRFSDDPLQLKNYHQPPSSFTIYLGSRI